jgi:hypothetical protein
VPSLTGKIGKANHQGLQTKLSPIDFICFQTGWFRSWGVRMKKMTVWSDWLQGRTTASVCRVMSFPPPL